MIVTEADLRQQLRPPRQGARVVVPAGAVLSPSAVDLVASWRLELAEEAPTVEDPAPWDRPARFTFTGDPGAAPPRCTACGSEVADKPDRLTQLNAFHLAPKAHPRIRLRGRLDELGAQTLLAAARSRETGDPATAGRLDTVAAYVRELLAAEYQERPPAPFALDGLDEAGIHHASHHPDTDLGVRHLEPSSDDPLPELLVNALRASARSVELAAIDAFPDPHHPAGQGLVHALNRLSSAYYYVGLRAAATRRGVVA